MVDKTERSPLQERLAELLDLPAELEGEAWEDALVEACRKLKKERDIYYLAMDNCIDSFHITDGAGNIVFINKVFERRSRKSKSEIIGQNVVEMERAGIYRPSAVRIALQEKRQLTMIQGGPGGDALVTATPLTDAEGEPIMCVSNARFVDDLTLLDKYYSEKAHQKSTTFRESEMVCQDEHMKQLYETARQVAGSNSSVLITGETGTGKSMLARYLHDHSGRRQKKFIELNCAAIPENLIESELFGYEGGAFTGAKKGGKPGMFELADGGTLFLDEIGDMPVNLQTKLLQALQNRTISRIGGTSEKKVDVRIITATNQNLEELIEKGMFRSDLYYRINVVPLYMPALRERQADIPMLARGFLKTFYTQYGKDIVLTEAAMNRLQNYMWLGNIRELENMIERLVVTNRTGIIDEQNLPSNMKIISKTSQEAIQINRMMPLKEALERVEKQLVERAFQQGGSSYQAARMLGISQSGASRKYLKYIKESSDR